jgi:hypothetical protein
MPPLVFAACLNFSETVLEAAERAPAGSLGVRAIPVADQILRGSPSCLTVSAQAGGKPVLAARFASASVDYPTVPSHITFMALSKKKATTIALDPEADQLLTRAARERGVSRSEFVRQQLALVLEQYRRHPKPRSAGRIPSLPERGNERELFGGRR